MAVMGKKQGLLITLSKNNNLDAYKIFRACSRLCDYTSLKILKTMYHANLVIDHNQCLRGLRCHPDEMSIRLNRLEKLGAVRPYTRLDKSRCKIAYTLES